MATDRTSHPFELLEQMDQLCQRMADAFPTDSKANEFWKGIGFVVGGETVVTPWDEVAEIQSLPNFTRVPGAKDWVKGVANVRGSLLPVMDLGSFMGFRSKSMRKQRLLVIQHDGIYSGLIVDEILGAMSFEQFEQMEYEPVVNENLKPFIRGGFTKQDTDWPVFSLHAVAESPDFRKVSRK